ncbi:16S rRNA pseudouridine(516) synthase RsuA [Thaumasiovibrio subtropicus]|uniref:16S rRNA pseudouridine(516) synthase RsuA n=1 Tax=Thaumasiovibrio subtropicus TaxID=1891207 RepID=UPI000B362461|nr:16S rRNA pseudouridine(516) synthase RsuA [Thaumasiovibrio subtropicus]
MRLDKYLTETLGVTRKQATKLLKAGEVTVDGAVVKQGATKLADDSEVVFRDRELNLTGPRYIMLNKPSGFVCSHVDDYNPTVFVLLDEVSPEKLHVAGRLDGDTTGLVLMTDDGQWSHRITSPKHVCEKTYFVELADPVPEETIATFAEGVMLRGEKELTRPAKLVLISETEARLTITEGKYHQVKRMFASVGNRVIGLHRERIGAIELDDALEPGDYRELTEEEVAYFL